MLLPGGRGGRPVHGKAAGDGLPRVQLQRPLPQPGDGRVCGRISGRAHPQPLRPVQPAGEVQRAAAPGGRAGAGLYRHRPLRPGGLGGGPLAAAPGQGPPQGPELCALPPVPGDSFPAAAAGGGLGQGGGPGPGGGPGAVRRPQAGQPGHLLCPGRGLPRLPPALRRRGAAGGGLCGSPGPGAGAAQGTALLHHRTAPGAGRQRGQAPVCTAQGRRVQHRGAGGRGGALQRYRVGGGLQLGLPAAPDRPPGRDRQDPLQPDRGRRHPLSGGERRGAGGV